MNQKENIDDERTNNNYNKEKEWISIRKKVYKINDNI